MQPATRRFFVICGYSTIALTPYLSYTDAELLSLLPEDNQQAFEALYSRHWETLYKAAFFILKDQHACKDIVQEVFVWLWQHRHGLAIRSLPAYLRSAVKFKVANHIRSGVTRSGFLEELAARHLSDAGWSAAELAEANELRTMIEGGISTLPDRCREIFRLSREEHLSNREIASYLGISVKTVEVQMTLALKKLRSRITGYRTGISVFLLLILCAAAITRFF